MKNSKTILTLGVIIALLPYTGFPSIWKVYLFTIFGVIIAVLAFRITLQERNNTAVSAENTVPEDSEYTSDIPDTSYVSTDTPSLEEESPLSEMKQVHE